MEKPYGVIVSPRLPSGEAAALVTESERLKADSAMVAELKALSRDEIGEQFGGTYYKTHYLFWEFDFEGTSVEVSRYYPDRGVAIDIFQEISEKEQREIDFKRALFARLKVRYGALSWASHPTDLLEQIGVS